MDYVDKNIACVDCQAEFVHSAADQRRYAELGYANEPKRCPTCRARRKNTMGGPGGGPRPRSGGAGGPGGGRGGSRELHTATCAECGQQTQVPFKPTEGRPVYCRDCYNKSRRY